MTNQEKYADILEDIQAEHPNAYIETFLGLTRDTQQPVLCKGMDCRECAWQGGDCTQLAKEWLAASADTTTEVKEKKQMTNQEKYADILEDIQKQDPDTPLSRLFGISKHTEQPADCRFISCNDCLWNEKGCNSAAEEWLAAPADAAPTNDTNKTKEKKQMKKKYAVNFEGNTYLLSLSAEQVKVFYFLRDKGWEVTVEEVKDNFIEL